MKPRHSFSSRHTRRITNIRKQRQKYPSIAEKIIENSDIILEVLDSRFIDETRNEELEEKILKKNKKLIYVLNKSDLSKNTNKILKPKVMVSCKNRKGIAELRNLIKKTAKSIDPKKIVDKDKNGKVTVGIIGYPNTGKSSLINLLIGKSSAGVGSDAGFTRNIQKLKLSEDIQLLDSPGVIPESEYSNVDKEKIAQHTKVGARSFSQVKDPEIAVHHLMQTHAKQIENFYKIDSKENAETLIEILGKQKGFLLPGGKVNEDKTSRLILKDWQTGKIKI